MSQSLGLEPAGRAPRTHAATRVVFLGGKRTDTPHVRGQPGRVSAPTRPPPPTGGPAANGGLRKPRERRASRTARRCCRHFKSTTTKKAPRGQPTAGRGALRPPFDVTPTRAGSALHEASREGRANGRAGLCPAPHLSCTSAAPRRRVRNVSRGAGTAGRAGARAGDRASRRTPMPRPHGAPDGRVRAGTPPRPRKTTGAVAAANS